MAGAARTFDHPLAIVAVAGTILAASWIDALARPVPGWEAAATRGLNDLPALAATVLFPVMQLGTVWAPLVVAAVVGAWRRDVIAGATIAVAGVAAWLGAKVVKATVERGRPAQYLAGIDVRSGDGSGFGFISGHSAVAAATATATAAVVGRRWRPVVVVLAAVVGLARVIHGVHLVADVTGGWAFGVIVGVVVAEVGDRVRDASAQDGSATTPSEVTSPSP